MVSTHRMATTGFTETVRYALACSGFCRPAADEARIVLFDSAAWAVYAPMADEWLNADERTRAARFHFERDYLAYVMAHAIWRVALSVSLGMEIGQVPLTHTSSGQPQLPGTGLSTSLSHSGNYVAMAICGASTVGIDIEQSPPRVALDDLLTTICTPAEAATLRELSPAALTHALLTLWTRKEALLKAFGIGLAQAPATLSAMSDEPVAPPPQAADSSPYRVRTLEVPFACVSALAAPATVVAYKLHHLSVA
jgi:4'-phosphopantetheinyl transferase